MTYVADDFAAIARRLKELETEKNPRPEPDHTGELSHAYRIPGIAQADEDDPYIGSSLGYGI